MAHMLTRIFSQRVFRTSLTASFAAALQRLFLLGRDQGVRLLQSLTADIVDLLELLLGIERAVLTYCHFLLMCALLDRSPLLHCRL